MIKAAGPLIKGQKIAVIGAGICGSLTAWYAQLAGMQVHVFEPDNNKGSCSFTAAGMLAPMAELENSSDDIYQLGKRSIKLWPSILSSLKYNIFYRAGGTLVVSHRQDRGVFQQFVQTLQNKLGDNFSNDCELLDYQNLEPELKNLGAALHLKNEAQVDGSQVLNGLHGVLKNRAHWHDKQVSQFGAYDVEGEQFDWVFDCRGLQARKEIDDLHGVRGEVITVHAPQVNILHMVRVMHPRYRIYIVPREDQHYMIGATEIQSDDTGPVSVRSTLELLSAAFSVHSGFAEARIISMNSHVRPTTMDHQPFVTIEPGLTRINGLYRHGFLLSPALVARTFEDMGIHIYESLTREPYADCI
jgi:glycine oxidase